MIAKVDVRETAFCVNCTHYNRGDICPSSPLISAHLCGRLRCRGLDVVTGTEVMQGDWLNCYSERSGKSDLTYPGHCGEKHVFFSLRGD